MASKSIPLLRVIEMDGWFYPELKTGEKWARFYRPVFSSGILSIPRPVGQEEISFKTLSEAKEYAAEYKKSHTRIIHEVEDGE